MSSPKNIVIIGGSYAGVSTAHYVLKHVVPKLPEQASYQVILVSAASQTMCRPACPRAMISDDMFDQKKLFVSITEAFEQYPKSAFRFIYGAATQLDHNSRTVSIDLSGGNTETIEYHSLVISTGSSTPSPLHGLNRNVDFLRSNWAEFRKALPHAKTIVIGGGGPAGVETAGELGEYLNGRAGWFSSAPEHPKVAITVVTAGSEILPALRTSLAEKAEKYLAKVGVTVVHNARIKSVSPPGAGTEENLTSKATLTLVDGKTIDADLYIPSTGSRPNTSFLQESLLAPDGRVETNITTLRVDKAGPRVYSAGDCSSAARPAIHNVLAEIPILCSNIRYDLLSASATGTAAMPNEKNGNNNNEATTEDRLFREDMRETQMVPIGKSKGVGAAMGYALPSFMIWLIKGRDYWLWTTGRLWSGKQWAKES